MQARFQVARACAGLALVLFGCSPYLATGLELTWLMSSGGGDYVGRPYVPGDAAFKKPQPAIDLP